MKGKSIDGLTTVIVFALCLEVFAGTSAAFKKNLQRAQEGDPASQFELAMNYDSGTGVDKDLAKALEWYRKAADQGHVSGMIQIAHHYEAGIGVEKSIATAAEWFEKARSSPLGSAAGWNLARLSRAGLIKEKYVGIPVEGGFVVTLVDESVTVEKTLELLAAKLDEIETGKAYWIGYNSEMLSVGARGEAAIPLLVDFIKQATDAKVRHAGMLALHLIGIECVVAGRFNENFKNRKAREAMWELMKVEGLTDEVSALLKRDPWPSDVPAIMDALAAVKGDCPGTLNALLRYALGKRPVDSGTQWMDIKFTKPKQYSERDFVRLAIDGIKENSSIQVEVEEGMLEQIPAAMRYGNSAPKKWEGTLEKLLLEIKDLSATFDYVESGRAVFYHLDVPAESGTRPILQFFFRCHRERALA